jgi:hypothetical protein
VIIVQFVRLRTTILSCWYWRLLIAGMFIGKSSFRRVFSVMPVAAGSDLRCCGVGPI